MSSTSNVQNLLSNVFRPTFVYAAGTGYQSRLEMTNIDTVSANTVKTYTASVGDPSNNVYVGTGSGNAYATLGASSNTSNTFLGVSAGGATSNVKNSVFLGYRSGYGASNSSNSISIGANTLNGGNSNVYIGYGTGITTGSNNIFIGPGLSQASVSNTMLVGSGTNILLNGDLVNKRVGINLSTLPTFDPSVPILLDVNGYARVGVTSNNGKLGVNIPPAYSLDVNGNMRVSDGYGTLIMSNDTSSNSVVTLSNVSANKSATLQSTGGFFSANGTVVIPNGGSSNIGTLKRGIVMISADDPTTTSNVSASKIFMATLSNGSFVTSDVGTSTSLASISNSLGDIVLSNTDSNVHMFLYSITYFPSPAGAAVTLANSGNYDIIISKYNSAGVVQWAARIGGSGADVIANITADTAGNVIVAGSYGSTPLTLYNSDGSSFATTLANSGSYDVFIVKYNSAGVVQWAARQVGAGTEAASTVSSDTAGNIIVAGYYGSTPFTLYNSDGSSFATTLANSGSADGFIAKYNSAGFVQWVARQGGAGSDGANVAVGSGDNLFVSGFFTSNPLTLYNSDGSSFATTLANSGSNDVFIAKYNSAGFVQWVARVGGAGTDYALTITADTAGNIIVPGYYTSNPLTLYNSDGSSFATTLANSGNNDVFIAKYNSAGFVQWVARIGGTGNDFTYDAAVDSAGNVIVVGPYASSPLTLYNSDGSSFATTLTNSGGNDGFIAKYNSAGFVQWVARVGGGGADGAYGVELDSAGNIIVTGSYESTPLTLYNSNGVAFVTTLANSGSSDGFIAKYNSAGFVQWAARQGGSGFDGTTRVAVDSAGNVITAGNSQSSLMGIFNA